MITTEEIAKIIYVLINKDITGETFNIGGKDAILLEKIARYLRKSINFPKDGEMQKYEINVSKLKKIYPLKTSAQYFKDFLKNFMIKS